MGRNYKEIGECIDSVLRKDTSGILFKEGYAIVNLKHWQMCDRNKYDIDKIALIENNIDLQSKINQITKVIKEGE